MKLSSQQFKRNIDFTKPTMDISDNNTSKIRSIQDNTRQRIVYDASSFISSQYPTIANHTYESNKTSSANGVSAYDIATMNREKSLMAKKLCASESRNSIQSNHSHCSKEDVKRIKSLFKSVLSSAHSVLQHTSSIDS